MTSTNDQPIQAQVEYQIVQNDDATRIKQWEILLDMIDIQHAKESKNRSRNAWDRISQPKKPYSRKSCAQKRKARHIF